MSKVNYMAYYRKRLKLSQQMLADKTNLTRQYISLLERGKHIPSLLDAFKISYVLNMQPSILFVDILDKAVLEVKRTITYSRGIGKTSSLFGEYFEPLNCEVKSNE